MATQNQVASVMAAGCVSMVVGVGGCSCLGLGAGTVGVMEYERRGRDSAWVEEQKEVRKVARHLAGFWEAFCMIPELPPTSKIPVDGIRVVPDWSGAWTDPVRYSSSKRSVLFAYRVEPSPGRFVVVAEADRVPGGPVHRVVVPVDVTTQPDCRAEVGELRVLHDGQ